MGSRETQSLIIDTAIELFNTHGSGAVSTNRIAEACGISKGNLHYHFKNKQEIIQWIFRRIVEEMDAGWYEDHLQPTVQHMAEMFARQLEFIERYRFFYREMAALLRGDERLRLMYVENRTRRLAALEGFFREMERAGLLVTGGSRESLRSLVVATWIVSDNWLNFAEFEVDDPEHDIYLEGYELILEMMAPYLSERAREEVSRSYEVFRSFLRASASVP